MELQVNNTQQRQLFTSKHRINTLYRSHLSSNKKSQAWKTNHPHHFPDRHLFSRVNSLAFAFFTLILRSSRTQRSKKPSIQAHLKSWLGISMLWVYKLFVIKCQPAITIPILGSLSSHPSNKCSSIVHPFARTNVWKHPTMTASQSTKRHVLGNASISITPYMKKICKV